MRKYSTPFTSRLLSCAIALFFLLSINNGLSAQNVICSGDSLYLTLSGQSGSIQWESSPDGNTWSNIPGATSTLLGTLPNADTWYRAAVTDGTCPIFYSDTTYAVISNLIADAGADTTACTGNVVSLGGSPAATGGTGPYTYNWTPPTGLSNPAIANPQVTPTGNATYSLYITDANGCDATDTVSVDTGGVAMPGSLTLSFTGSIVTFTVPTCVSSLTIEVWGAQGGRSGGNGARMKGDFAVTAGQVLSCLVGEKGKPGANDVGSGGGGGSFVVDANSNPLIIAGGGGGVGHSNAGSGYADIGGSTATAGKNGQYGPTGLGGTNGNGGQSGNTSPGVANNSAGGGGFLTNGGGSGPVDGGDSFLNGGAGGNNTGGFGGGGGGTGAVFSCGQGNLGGSGGGGYSGGGGGGSNCNGAGGGGGSINNGTNQSNTAAVQPNNGQIIITW